MRADLSRHFLKRLAKMPKRLRQKVAERLKLFKVDPFHPLLRNHALAGKYAGYRSINITGDIRAVFTLVGDDCVRFEDIGTHSELYE